MVNKDLHFVVKKHLIPCQAIDPAATLDSWGSQDILAGFEPADPRSNRGESVFLTLIN